MDRYRWIGHGTISCELPSVSHPILFVTILFANATIQLRLDK